MVCYEVPDCGSEGTSHALVRGEKEIWLSTGVTGTAASAVNTTYGVTSLPFVFCVFWHSEEEEGTNHRKAAPKGNIVPNNEEEQQEEEEEEEKKNQ
ncbi:hypothetical protein H920_05635 [Fukomys damarensis]|uniref:Uncharacterized protein n=1 Tax=Fukomys damarensis TaxID=885580 RepID=A0A091DLL5_FUKDA|nr:hypothetical protein H920_05635 [Fukomys damarensis]